MRRPTRHLLAFALAGLALGACGDGENIQCEFTGSASATVGGGTSQTGFLALQTGAPMEVTLGPQGLYMITPSVRVQNMYPGESGRTGNANDPEISFEVHMGGTLIGGSAREHLGLTTGTLGAERLGVFTPFTADRAEYIGKLVTVSVQVDDVCGRSASGVLDVTAQ